MLLADPEVLKKKGGLGHRPFLAEIIPVSTALSDLVPSLSPIFKIINLGDGRPYESKLFSARKQCSAFSKLQQQYRWLTHRLNRWCYSRKYPHPPLEEFLQWSNLPPHSKGLFKVFEFFFGLLRPPYQPQHYVHLLNRCPHYVVVHIQSILCFRKNTRPGLIHPYR